MLKKLWNRILSKKPSKYLLVIAYVGEGEGYAYETVVADIEQSLEATIQTYKPYDYFFSHIHFIKELDDELYRFVAS
jgi:hypothetical protein